VLLKGSVRAIIELKGTYPTDLSRVESQGFGYLVAILKRQGSIYLTQIHFGDNK
jgi:hypothetical protein